MLFLAGFAQPQLDYPHRPLTQTYLTAFAVLLASNHATRNRNANVNSARLILVSLICAVPAIVLVDGPIVEGLVVAVLSGGIGVVAGTLRQGEAGFLLTVIRPIAGFAIIPAVWMLFQIIPLNHTGLAHPIWQSAEQALGYRISGSISVKIPPTSSGVASRRLSRFSYEIIVPTPSCRSMRATRGTR